MKDISQMDYQTFVRFMENGEKPFNYEQQVFKNHLERLLRIKDGKLTPPYELELQPSSRCNVDCSWCLGKGYPMLENSLDNDSMVDAVNKIADFEIDGFRIETIKFSGYVGEPLVNPSTIEGMKVLIERKRRVGLFTNGMLLDRKASDGTRYLDTVSRASYLHLSLDAGSNETMHILKGKNASFDKAVSNLRLVIDERERSGSKLEIGVGYIVTPENWYELYATTHKLKDYGADFIRFKVDITGKHRLDGLADSVLLEIDKAKELQDDGFRVVFVHQSSDFKGEHPEIYNIHDLGDIQCYTTKLWGTLGSDGNVYHCDHRTRRDAASCGDLRKMSYAEIWKSKNNNLPDKDCHMCSPYGTRINQFLNFLMSFEKDGILSMKERYFGGGFK